MVGLKNPRKFHKFSYSKRFNGGIKMEININLDCVYMISPDVVAREIEGELIIVPLVAGIGDMEDELYTVNKTGRLIWKKLDGKLSLNEIAQSIADDFSDSPAEIEDDVVGFINELVKRKIIVEATSS